MTFVVLLRFDEMIVLTFIFHQTNTNKYRMLEQRTPHWYRLR